MKEIADEWHEYIESGDNVQPILASTIETKEKHGSLTPDLPLVEYGDMLMSIGHEAVQEGESVVTGSVFGTDNKWPYHEYGLGRMERPTLRPVWDMTIDDKVERIADEFFDDLKNEFSN
jgi:hypothetical protein